MESMLLVSAASAALATGYLAWRRHYRGQLLLLAGTGWVVFFLGLALAFQVLPHGPQLFLLGGIVGAVLQHVHHAARSPQDVGVEGKRQTT